MPVDLIEVHPTTMTALLNMPYNYNVSAENMAELANLVVHILKHKRCQQILLETNFHHLMTFFLSTYSTYIQDAAFLPLSSVNEQEKSAEDIAASIGTRTELIGAFAEIALRCEDIENIRHELSELVQWLRALEPQIQICACLFLGNLACNPRRFGKQIVCLPQLGDSLSNCLNTAQRPEILSSAFDLLQNLSVELENREKLGEIGLLQALARCWSPKAADLQSCRRALYHTRQLICGSLPSVYIILRKIDNPEPSWPDAQTLISQLLLVFEQSEDPTSKAEVGRITAEIWRTINRDSHRQTILELSTLPLAQIKAKNVLDDTAIHRNLPCLIAQEILENFQNKAAFRLIEPSLGLIRSDNETLITEGWLTLSLMAMWKGAALIIYEKLCWDMESGLNMLLETQKAQDSRSGAYANARYLIAQLSKQLVSLPSALISLHTHATRVKIQNIRRRWPSLKVSFCLLSMVTCKWENALHRLELRLVIHTTIHEDGGVLQPIVSWLSF